MEHLAVLVNHEVLEVTVAHRQDIRSYSVPCTRIHVGLHNLLLSLLVVTETLKVY